LLGEAVAEVRTHWKGMFAFGIDLQVVNPPKTRSGFATPSFLRAKTVDANVLTFAPAGRPMSSHCVPSMVSAKQFLIVAECYDDAEIFSTANRRQTVLV
jgi:hypothetical protein